MHFPSLSQTGPKTLAIWAAFRINSGNHLKSLRQLFIGATQWLQKPCWS